MPLWNFSRPSHYHHHCNNAYVPQQFKGTRRTLTMQNNNGWHWHDALEQWAYVHLVRCQATNFGNSTSPGQLPPLIAEIMDLQEPSDQLSRPPKRADDGTSEGCSPNQCDLSPAGQSRGLAPTGALVLPITTSKCFSGISCYL